MAIKVYGVRAYRKVIPSANTPIPIWDAIDEANGHDPWVGAFRIHAPVGNTDDIAIGGSEITIATVGGAVTDGEPVSPSGSTEFGISPKIEGIVTEIELGTIFAVSAVANQVIIVTYIAKQDSRI